MDAKKVNIFHVERIAYLAAALQVGRPESLAGPWLVQFSPFGRLCRAAFDELLNRWTIASCAEPIRHWCMLKG